MKKNIVLSSAGLEAFHPMKKLLKALLVLLLVLVVAVGGLFGFLTVTEYKPADVEAVVDSYPWTWKLVYSRDRYNPIPAFVKLARRIYVTAESTGMLSEACTFGTARVEALDNLKPGGSKFRRFLENLRRDGYIDGSRKIDTAQAIARAKTLLGVQ